MKNTNDLRVIKTEKAIIEAFLKLLSEKAFESVTVNDITFLDTLQISLDYIEQNSRLFTSIAQSRYSDMLIGLFSEQLSREIKKYIEREIGNSYIGEVSSELTVQFLTGALIQTAGRWFFNRNKISKEEITKEVKAFIKKTVAETK